MAKILMVALLAVVVASCAGRKKIAGKSQAYQLKSVTVLTAGIDPEIQALYGCQWHCGQWPIYDLSDPLSNKTIYFEYDSSCTRS